MVSPRERTVIIRARVKTNTHRRTIVTFVLGCIELEETKKNNTTEIAGSTTFFEQDFLLHGLTLKGTQSKIATFCLVEGCEEVDGLSHRAEPSAENTSSFPFSQANPEDL